MSYIFIFVIIILNQKWRFICQKMIFDKQLLLNEFKTLSKGKNKEEIVPLIFALSQKAKQAGIQFTRQDCELIYKQIVPGGNPPEG